MPTPAACEIAVLAGPQSIRLPTVARPATPLPPSPAEAARRQHNDAMLAQLYPGFADRLAAILDDLAAEGWRPRITLAWRQRAGAKECFTLHHVIGKAGRKESLAAELADEEVSDGPAVCRFLIALAAAARRRGCRTGILDGLADDDAGAVVAAIDLRDDEAKLPLGTAPARVSPIGLTAAEARAGKRLG